MPSLPWGGLTSPGSGPVLVLVRHGRTRWNAEHRFQGSGPDSDLPLDDEGRTDVSVLGARLRDAFDAVYSSPMRRAQQTASVLASEFELLPAVTEQHMGALEGLRVSDGLAQHPAFFEDWAKDPGRHRVPGGGESLGDVRDRALPALSSLKAAHGHEPDAVVAVVTHQMVIAAVSCAIAGVPMREYQDFTVPNLGMTVLVSAADGGFALGPVAVDLFAGSSR